MQLGIVTATTNPERSRQWIDTWQEHASGSYLPVHVVKNAYLGTVPAFRVGVDAMLERWPGIDLIACLHDDVRILEHGWDERVRRAFERHPEVGLLGFGGAIGLGADDLYERPYDPMALARRGFRSNLVNAEAHGIRSLVPEVVACLDGFSQIGRRVFWEGHCGPGPLRAEEYDKPPQRPWTFLEDHSFIHHFYDGALACLARRAGWQAYYLPIYCHHLGGQTAVGDPGYQHWAATQIEGGDRGFWETAHRRGYDLFGDVLPLRTDQA